MYILCVSSYHSSLIVLYIFVMAMPVQIQYSMGQAGSQLLGSEVSLEGRMAHGSHTKRPQNCRRGSKVNTAEANCEGLIKGDATKYIPRNIVISYDQHYAQHATILLCLTRLHYTSTSGMHSVVRAMALPPS